VPLLPELVADHDFHHRSASNAGTSGLILFKDRIRRRPQRPGNQHALTRGQQCSPAIATGSAAIIQQAQEALTLSVPITLRQAGVVRNRKTSFACAEAVNYADYLWKATEKIG
jgi:hypothetical protein